MILIIDNYDSFTYNLVQYIGSINQNLEVRKNNKISIKDIYIINPEKIIISPGPGRPENAGISIDIIKEFGDKIPILGICLGLQAITIAYGGEVIHADEVVHGKTSDINHYESLIFNKIPSTFKATRYHSLIIDKKNIGKDLIITAETKDNVIMGIIHKKFNVHGIQFHPESIKTICGLKILSNFLKYKIK